MKATGIIRRIDDLGRVVIPKEVRRTMKIREGDPLEIYTDREGYVCFKKYEPSNEPDIKNALVAMIASIGAIDKNLRAAVYTTDGIRIRSTHPSIFPTHCSDTPDQAPEIEECFNVIPIRGEMGDTIAYLVIDDDHNRELVGVIIRTTEYTIREMA